MKIAAVIVTHNKLELLKKCVLAVKRQTYRPDDLIIINNNSNDGTTEWLNELKDAIILNQENLGGANGYNIGIKIAYQKGYDWIWTLDDDAIPLQDTLSKLLDKINKKENIGILCSVILNEDNSVQKISMPELQHRTKIINDLLNEEKIVSISSCSFLSVIFNREVIKKYGLPIKEMFINYDDVEYTNRILCNDKFKGYMVLESKCYHISDDNFDKKFIKINKTTYIFLRNYFFVTKKTKVNWLDCMCEVLTSYLRIIKILTVK